MICFHYTYYLMAISYVLCGYYINLIVFTTLIIVHEFGHYITARLLSFKVDKIVIYPFGGITKINDMINKDINSELLVATSGVIYQFLFFLIICYLNNKGIIRNYTMDIYRDYNSQIIFFNLLPIYPLDGSKIFNLLLSKWFNYNSSNKLTILISIICMVIFVLLNTYVHNYSYFMIVSILFVYNYKYFGQIKYLYNRFLLERYLYNIKYSKTKIIDNPCKMYKNKMHIFKLNNKYISEKKYLSKYYFK